MDVHSLYTRTTDKKGVVSLNEHRVWDSGKYLVELTANAKLDGIKVEVLTEAEYKALKIFPNSISDARE